MLYYFNVEETNYGSVVIEADNIDEAREKAERAYEFGNVTWGSSGAMVDFDHYEDCDGKIDNIHELEQAVDI